MNSRRPWQVAMMAIALALSQLAFADNRVAPSDAEVYALGARIYERCAACHALDFDRTGPRHCGLLGRRAGSVPGFPYSSAMRRAKMVWTAKNLDRFLKSPVTTIPGTSMGYDGIKDDEERHALIHYLREVGQESICQALLSDRERHIK